MSIRSVFVIAALTVGSAPALAGVVTGRVMSNGLPVAGANLDFRRSSGGGGGVTELNDGTDANGYFTTTVTPDNVYDMTIVPAPGSHVLVTTLPNIVLGPTLNNLGTIQLPAGVLLSGRCVSALGAGIAGINVDVLDANGANVDLSGDMTDATGGFTVAAPAGVAEVRFDTTGVVGPLFAPRWTSVTLGADVDLGEVVFAPGFVVSALVRRQSNNTAVDNVEVDVFDSATDALLYTPGDNTDPAGFVDFVVPAGTFDIQFTPPFALHLVGRELRNRVVSGSASLGTLLLQNGFVLSGTVAGFDASLHGGVDVDVKYAATGTGVFLGADNTNAAGFYQVIVPSGTFHVTFSPPLAIPFGAVTLSNVGVASNKTLNATLPSCPFYALVGSGLAGLGGITPQISAIGGAPRVGNSNYAFRVEQGRGGAKAVIIFSTLPMPNPLPIPYQRLAPDARRILTLSGPLDQAGAGSATFPYPLADDPALAGYLIRAWVHVRDAATINRFTRTHELRATLCL